MEGKQEHLLPFLTRYNLSMTQVLEHQIKSLVRKTVKETLRAELANLRASLLPLVAEEEMADIAKRYKRPTRRATRTIRTTL